MWSVDLILELAVQAFRDEDRGLREEQAVHGLDRNAEIGLHAILARSLTARGLGVFREQVYPCSPIPTSRRTERQRCDLVLTPSPDLAPIDPDEARRAAAASAGTLFAHTLPPPTIAGCPPEDAFWLELKTVGQFTFSRGVPIPNSTYSAELRAGLAADLDKLAADPMIRHAAAMLILFSADADTARHDVEVLHDRAARLGPGRPFLAAGFDIPDRIGNRRCTLVAVPVR